MEPILQFNPTAGIWSSTVIISFVIAAVALVLFYINIKKKVAYPVKNHQNIFSMIILIVAFIAFLTGIFQAVLNSRLGNIKVFSTQLELPEGKIGWGNIKKLTIYDNRRKGRTSQIPEPGTEPGLIDNQLLLIEEYSGKVHVFAQKDYDIMAIHNAIKNQLEKYWASRKREKEDAE